MTAVVISGHKILLLVMDEHRVAHVMVFPPACIHTILVEVHIVEGFMRNGPVCKPVFTMERHELRALRKTNLVILVDQRRYIRPIKHRIVILSGIDQTSTDLHIGFPRTERDSDRPLSRRGYRQSASHTEYGWSGGDGGRHSTLRHH